MQSYPIQILPLFGKNWQVKFYRKKMVLVIGKIWKKYHLLLLVIPCHYKHERMFPRIINLRTVVLVRATCSSSTNLTQSNFIQSNFHNQILKISHDRILYNRRLSNCHSNECFFPKKERRKKQRGEKQ